MKQNIMVRKGNNPQMAYFSLVKYCDLPKYNDGNNNYLWENGLLLCVATTCPLVLFRLMSPRGWLLKSMVQPPGKMHFLNDVYMYPSIHIYIYIYIVNNLYTVNIKFPKNSQLLYIYIYTYCCRLFPTVSDTF